MPVFEVEVEKNDSWVYTVAATTEEEAERAALDSFRRLGGFGGDAQVTYTQERDDMDEADAELTA